MAVAAGVAGGVHELEGLDVLGEGVPVQGLPLQRAQDHHFQGAGKEVALLAIFAPFLSPYAFSDTDFNSISCAPAWWTGRARCHAGGAHWFGTDALGRDLFVRTLLGARVSLAVGIVATMVSLVIGVLYGAVAGFVGGRTDSIMTRAEALIRQRILDAAYGLFWRQGFLRVSMDEIAARRVSEV